MDTGGSTQRRSGVTEARTQHAPNGGNGWRLAVHVAFVGLVVFALLVPHLVPRRRESPPTDPTPLAISRQRLLIVFRLSGAEAAQHDAGFMVRRLPAHTEDSQAPSTPDNALWTTAIGSGSTEEPKDGFGERLGFMTRGLDPEGSLTPVARTEVITYIVRPGDTLWDIAAKFNLSQDSLWANNDLASPDFLSIGDVLTIPPTDGLLYTVRPGDTLASIAQRYRAKVEDIIAYKPNGLHPGEEPRVGQQIMIPGGVKPIPPRRTVALTRVPRGAPKGTGRFVMPVSGILTQGFSAKHRAIDIAAPRGTPVYAADAGYVVFAGWHPWGYGYAVVIDHGNGFRTLYAHLSWYAPDVGDSVRRGELIGGVGSSYGPGGYATGPHLHFELIQNGMKRNPCLFLPCP